MKKLSAVLIEMAETLLAQPLDATSPAAGDAALLLAQVAWNREVHYGRADTGKGYLRLLARFEEEDSTVRAQLKSYDCEELIEGLRAFKRKHYPDDNRSIIGCGRNERGNVRVIWQNGEEERRTSRST